MKTLASCLWDFWKSKCEYRNPICCTSSKSICECSYFPKYILKGKRYGKAYLEVRKIASMSEVMRKQWWGKHTRNRTFRTCPMIDFLRQINGIKGGGKYYKEFV